MRWLSDRLRFIKEILIPVRLSLFSELTHWGRDKMAAISQTTLSKPFSWMKMFEFRLKLKLVPKGPLDNIPALVQIMAWHRLGDKPLSEPMMAKLVTHICVIQPQWVKAQSTLISKQSSKKKQKKLRKSTTYSISFGNSWNLYQICFQSPLFQSMLVIMYRTMAPIK